MLDRLENAKKFESPAQVITARGISIKIKDIAKNVTLKGKAQELGRNTNFQDSLQSDK